MSNYPRNYLPAKQLGRGKARKLERRRKLWTAVLTVSVIAVAYLAFRSFQ
jgi:hypothetical protein